MNVKNLQFRIFLKSHLIISPILFKIQITNDYTVNDCRLSKANNFNIFLLPLYDQLSSSTLAYIVRLSEDLKQDSYRRRWLNDYTWKVNIQAWLKRGKVIRFPRPENLKGPEHKLLFRNSIFVTDVINGCLWPLTLRKRFTVFKRKVRYSY